MTHPTDETLARLEAVVGAANATRDPGAMGGRLSEWRGKYTGATPLLVRPGTTEEVAALVRICAETNTALVPQGGNTGLVGGQIPTGSEILLSLDRMTAIRALDADNNTITVEAGCILADIQHAADLAGRRYPLSLASEGSARIGGLLSTNAGGINVLRYGSARAHVLGLEVVLPDGRVWHGLKTLYKDNTGYDLKSLFVGAEGTLGIITATSLRLWPRPGARETAFTALRDPAAAIRLLNAMQASTGGQVSAFELVPRIGIDFLLRHAAGTRDPFAAPAPWYALVEVEAGRTEGLRASVEAGLAVSMGHDCVVDAVIAESEAQRAALWALRERLSDVQKHEGGSIKHDIAVPVSHVPAFIAEASAAVSAACPGVRPVIFGHVGDGNLHFNVTQPAGADTAAFLARWEEIACIVHDITARHRGSISAEHGIGIMKVGELERLKDPVEIDMMRTLKKAFDPHYILNPGKVLSAPGGTACVSQPRFEPK